MTIGLPFLSAMLQPRRSHADNTTPVRFLVFYSPGGTLLDKWRPKGTPASFTLQPMMSPLIPFLDRIVMIDGLDLSITKIGVGHPHSRGMAGVLTGQQLLPGTFNTNMGTAGFADGPSIDQVIAEKISSGLRFKSLEVSTAWSTGLAVGGSPHPANEITYAGSKSPIPPQTRPWDAFQRMFATLADPNNTARDAVAAQQARTTAILDTVTGQYQDLSRRLGGEDRAKLEAHLALIRDVEKRLTAPAGGTSSTCHPPTMVNPTPGYYEEATTKAADGQNIIEGAKVPEKGKIMTDLLVAAMACDLTRVGTMQWSDSEANFLLKFLNGPDGKQLVDHHHGYQHDRGFQPGALEVIYNWYAGNFVYLLQRLDEIKESNGSLLDNTLVFWVTEIQKPDSHEQNSMPFVLAGKAGGKLKGNRWLKVASQPHNNLLVSILNMFGFDQTKFGHPDFGTGPLADLV